MWPDNETTEDLIGFQVHVDLIRAVVSKTSLLPTTIGIFGDWGGGKTSIMRMLERDLDADRWPAGSIERKHCERTAVVYANTWLFEGYDDAKAALLTCVLTELAEHKRFGPKVRDAASSLLRSVNWMRMGRLTMKHSIPALAAFLTGGVAAVPAALAVSFGLGGLISQPPSKGEKKDKTSEGTASGSKGDGAHLLKTDPFRTEISDIRTFRKRFSKMLTDGGIETLVVLLDDLDRCDPERIIDNLEAVKLFLSVPQTAFVIGADRRIVEHAIRFRYAARAIDSANDEDTRRLVKDYLEKLVQVPYSLPRLSPSEIETYMVLLFCTIHLEPTELAVCLKACHEARDRNRYGSFGYGAVRAALKKDDLAAELTEALTLAATAAPQITDGLKGNPRQVKRFLNALLLRKQLAGVARLNHINDPVLVKLMILEYAHTDLFTQLFAWQSQQDGRPQQIAELEAILSPPRGNVDDEEGAKKIDARWATSSIRRWLATEPLLADVDLRDYFWIARDRLESTFAGISMVPPIVRTVLDALMSGLAPKRNEAMKAARDFSEEERGILLSQIDHRVSRQPDEKAGYDALRSLAETGMPGSAELLALILTQRSLESVPAAVGMDLITLYSSKPELRAALQEAKERLENSPTRVGRAAKAARPPKA